MVFQTADWVILGFTATLAVTGLFRGFSGTLAFLAASFAAAAVSGLGWHYSESFMSAVWLRALATLVAALLAFGIVRALVRKIVNGLLAQPADAIFGFLCGLLAGALVVVVWAYGGYFLEYSTFATEVADYVR